MKPKPTEAAIYGFCLPALLEHACGLVARSALAGSCNLTRCVGRAGGARDIMQKGLFLQDQPEQLPRRTHNTRWLARCGAGASANRQGDIGRCRAAALAQPVAVCERLACGRRIQVALRDACATLTLRLA